MIDTREPYEYARSHVDGAINISGAEFASGILPKILTSASKDTPIILYCLSGQRSNTCGIILGQYGFTNITNGINEGRTRQLLAKY
ncbi:rhodanese-like domain-containing protein [Candidatus Saccharibacteria bacterium]|nr:rhodanese-like domain-containing protein [Candidatus Saccharibacteria bacterium]NCU40279.1 rhodanese-like domain-containing protein [Candidatus Saccharibacteria bacterium]